MNWKEQLYAAYRKNDDVLFNETVQKIEKRIVYFQQAFSSLIDAHDTLDGFLTNQGCQPPHSEIC